MRIANDVTELVGNTPLVRLRHLTEDAKSAVVAKLGRRTGGVPLFADLGD